MFVETLREHLGPIASLSPAQLNQLQQHYELLLRWNKMLNLTAVRELDEVVERHYCESIFLAAHLPAIPLTIADVGSGAGFPGTPVAICRPDCRVILIESHQRKAVFLRESTRALSNVSVLAQRAENVQRRFDWAVSRAVRPSGIARSLRRLAPNMALLAGEEIASELPEFSWQPPIRLPWGRKRFLWTTVSRETQPVPRFT